MQLPAHLKNARLIPDKFGHGIYRYKSTQKSLLCWYKSTHTDAAAHAALQTSSFTTPSSVRGEGGGGGRQARPPRSIQAEIYWRDR
jgi:hypothetical protein